MVLELVGLSPAHAHDDRSRYDIMENCYGRSNLALVITSDS